MKTMYYYVENFLGKYIIMSENCPEDSAIYGVLVKVITKINNKEYQIAEEFYKEGRLFISAKEDIIDHDKSLLKLKERVYLELL